MTENFKKIKILFLIHDLGQGGAEKVLVNLVNNMDRSKFDISVTVLFGGGVNEQFLRPDIHFRAVWAKSVPGNSKLMKALSPEKLHRICVKDHYDIEVSYLEGPSARIISGCKDPKIKKVCWIHVEQKTAQKAAESFRSVAEAADCYNRFDRIIAVSDTVRQDFTNILHIRRPVDVLYNTNESAEILKLAEEPIEDGLLQEGEFHLVGVGKLVKTKGFDRLIRITKLLADEGYPVHLFILGKGPEKESLEKQAKEARIETKVTFLGYQTNPYKYVAKADLFVCASLAEGFSTAATEALILGIPVCTVEVSGMKEMLGEHNEYGLVTENTEEALYQGIRNLLDQPVLLAHYKEQAIQRGKDFRTEETVKAAEEMLWQL